MNGDRKMPKRKSADYEIQYTKIAEKFLKVHEDVRIQYEQAIKELLVGEHPEKIDVKRSELLGNKLPSFLFQPLLLGYT